MKEAVQSTLNRISLKARILREFQIATRAKDKDLSEREVFILELINSYNPMEEKGICRILGLSFSSVGDMVRKLVRMDLIDKSEKQGGLTLAHKGRERVKQLQKENAARFTDLFESTSNPEDSLTAEEWKILLKLFEKVDRNAARQIQRRVFDDYSS